MGATDTRRRAPASLAGTTTNAPPESEVEDETRTAAGRQRSANYLSTHWMPSDHLTPGRPTRSLDVPRGGVPTMRVCLRGRRCGNLRAPRGRARSAPTRRARRSPGHVSGGRRAAARRAPSTAGTVEYVAVQTHKHSELRSQLGYAAPAVVRFPRHDTRLRTRVRVPLGASARLGGLVSGI